MRIVINLISYFYAIFPRPIELFSDQKEERRTMESVLMNAVNYLQVTDCTHDAAQ